MSIYSKLIGKCGHVYCVAREKGVTRVYASVKRPYFQAIKERVESMGAELFAEIVEA